MYVPGIPRPRPSSIRVVKIVARRPETGLTRDPALSFRAKCDRCGWLGRPRVDQTAAWRSASSHACVPIAGGYMATSSEVTRFPWLRP